jgi:flagellar basal body rod protein FlgC
MNTIMNIGVSAMRVAGARAQVSAINIANWNSHDYRPLEARQSSAANGPVVHITRAADISSGFPLVDIAAELVDLEMAKFAFKASALIIRTSGEMTKTTLDTFA